MGLNVTHGAFDGAYSAFQRFRMAVAEATGGHYPPRSGERWEFGPGYDSETNPGLYAFFMSDDCKGSFPPEVCAQIADEMEVLLPAIQECNPEFNWGRIELAGGMGAVAARYIAGCRLAATQGEHLEYH